MILEHMSYYSTSSLRSISFVLITIQNWRCPILHLCIKELVSSTTGIEESETAGFFPSLLNCFSSKHFHSLVIY